MRKRLSVAFSLMLLASLALAACQGQSVQVPVTVVVKETQPPVVQTQIQVQTQVVNQTEVVEVPQGAFTRPNPILSDLSVRQAMSYCTNKDELIASVYPLLSPDERAALVMNTNIPR